MFSRPNSFLLVLCIIGLLSTTGVSSQAVCNPTELRCEYLVCPLGIDGASPRLSWLMNDRRPGAKQTAFRLTVGTDSVNVKYGRGNAWESGRMPGSLQLARYAGVPLRPFTKYYWLVELWDKDSLPSASALSSFETGLMDMKNWKGDWITDTRDIHLKPAPYFRKTFTANKKVHSARAYIAAAGLYELYINGNRIGDHRLDPMFTRFDRRTLYVTYDITNTLRDGRNAVGVLLGNGWYNLQSTAVWYFHEAPWRGRPSFCVDIRITYDDGSMETVSSDKTWKTALSPITFNSIYTGEHYDARLEIPHWNEAGYNDSAWKEVMIRSAPSANIVAQTMHPIRNVEEVHAAVMKKFSDTLYVFDLGRNIAGVSSITLTGERGTQVRLKHGERLFPSGRVDQSNIDAHYRPTDDSDPFQTDIYILNGNGAETFTPHFNYKGFQFIQVSSDRPVILNREDLTAYFMHTDVPVAGGLKSSEPLIDKIWTATNNSYLSNLFGYPTDCPQREKNGWTGDAQIAVETGLYNFDGITLYEKWLADHRDEQQPNGVLPSIIPTGGWGYEWGNGPDWTSTIAIIPWNVYLFYGDAGLLKDSYSSIKKYVDHINEKYPGGLTTWGLGDWIPVKSKSPVEFTSTAYYYTDVMILAKAAKLFGSDEDYRTYSTLAAVIKNAFNAKYFNESTGVYGTGLQTELSVALFWDLVPAGKKEMVAANLAKKVAADGNKLDVGLLGTKAILNALSENGYADAAYGLASSKTFPSWGWWIANGATTLYENWPIDAKSDLSMNHIMFGEIGAWLYKSLGGIKPDPAQPGFKNILLAPHFVKGLDSISITHDGPYGTIRSAWKRIGKRIIYSVVIPPNSTATVQLPVIKGLTIYENGRKVAGEGRKLEAGEYGFEWR
jgi:alpha-L-rhamnosidase